MLFNISRNQMNMNGSFNTIDLVAFLKKIVLPEIIILIVISVFTILGNTLVLVTTWREKRLHQPNKYFIASLAVADLLVGWFIAPLRLHIDNLFLKTHSSATKSVHLCRFIKWIDTFALTASIFSLTFISFDRYLKINRPLHYKQKMTTSTCLIFIFIIWLISSAFASFSLTPYSGGFGISIIYYCDNFTEKDYNQAKVFYTVLVVFVLFLPTIVILAMYILIFFAAHKRQKMLRNRGLGDTLHEQYQRSAFRQDLKVIRVLLAVVGAFIFCWYPFVIYKFLRLYSPERFYQFNWKVLVIIAEVVRLLPLFNSLCNPVIYACLDEKYREAFKNQFQQMKSLVCLARSRVANEQVAVSNERQQVTSRTTKL